MYCSSRSPGFIWKCVPTGDSAQRPQVSPALAPERRPATLALASHQIESGSGEVLHNDPELGALQVRAVILGDEGRVALGQHHDLLLDVLNIVLGVLQVDNLDGHDLVGAGVDASSWRAQNSATRQGEAACR